MKNIVLTCLWLWISSGYLYSQQVPLTIHIKDEHTLEPLAGAIIQFHGTSISGVTNSLGIWGIADLSPGQYRINVRLLGYEQKEVRHDWSGDQSQTIEILLHEKHGELETVTVTTTRSSRTIADIPTRVEFIAGEELDEKANMKPGDIRLLLSESTGIMVQTTSATSANASIRIQGLDGRYTQILRDGFPLYSGGAAGLSLLQIAPLDLGQVEVIKGSASTLYGGGAIAGLVNLITKRPTEKGETSILLNGTSAGGFDASTFYGKRNKHFGTTLFAAYNANSAYDPSDIGLSAIPRFQRFTFNPRLFVYPSSKFEIDFGLNMNHENRKGGDMRLLKNQTSNFDGFFEQNISTRVSSQLAVNQKTQTGKAWQFKNAVSYFDRNMTTKGFGFQGNQLSTFTEINYQINGSKTDWVFGGNLLSERFEEKTESLPRDFNLSTIGAFAQNTWTITEKWILEIGLRTDGVSNYGMVVLPRLALLWKTNSEFSTRLGGGLGYKTPTIFTEESERLQYRFILPLDQANTKLERSYGLNWDVNYRKALIDDQLVVHINHLFFYTYLQNPLYLQSLDNGMFMMLNDKGWADTKGIETNIRWELGDFKWLVGYTYTQAMLNTGDGLRENPLTPRHRINSILFYEVHEHWKIGWESYAFSQQRLSDGSVGRAYWIMGFMAERIWENLSIYINFENFLDARQTRFDSIFTGSIEAPQFREIYAPLDGFVVNGGLKIRLN
jgi:outer membrane receptor for ferrienterochelin and colicins